QNNIAKFCWIRPPKRSCAGIGKFSQEQRYPLPVSPIKCATAGLVFGGPLCLHFIVFNEDPSQVARLQVQNLLKQISSFRQIHAANTKVEAVRRHSAFARDAIKNSRGDLKIDAARSNKKGVKFGLMRGEKPEFLRNSTIDFWKRQDDAQTNTGDEECGCTNPCVSQRSNENTAAVQFVWRRRLDMNLRNGLADWHSQLPIT